MRNIAAIALATALALGTSGAAFASWSKFVEVFTDDLKKLGSKDDMKKVGCIAMNHGFKGCDRDE